MLGGLSGASYGTKDFSCVVTFSGVISDRRLLRPELVGEVILEVDIMDGEE